MEPGKFITFEGIEGVGKSTNMAHMGAVLERHGQAVLRTREPGGTPMAERIRRMVAEHGDEAVPDIAELLLIFAARALHVRNVIRPALAAGTWVLCDRFTDSSRAYQGGGRGLPTAVIEQLAEWVHHDLQPDVTVLLDAPVDLALQRAGRRGSPDRFESEQRAFFVRVRERYLELAAAEPARIVVVDAARELDAVAADIERIAVRLVSNI